MCLYFITFHTAEAHCSTEVWAAPKLIRIMATNSIKKTKSKAFLPSIKATDTSLYSIHNQWTHRHAERIKTRVNPLLRLVSEKSTVDKFKKEKLTQQSVSPICVILYLIETHIWSNQSMYLYPIKITIHSDKLFKMLTQRRLFLSLL